VGFIIVTSAGLPEEPVPRWRSVLLDFTSLLDLRVTLAITSRQRLADLVDENRRQRACSAHAVFFRFGDSVWNFRERQSSVARVALSHRPLCYSHLRAILRPTILRFCVLRVADWCFVRRMGTPTAKLPIAVARSYPLPSRVSPESFRGWIAADLRPNHAERLHSLITRAKNASRPSA
jgi:hypothetical protein